MAGRFFAGLGGSSDGSSSPKGNRPQTRIELMGIDSLWDAGRLQAGENPEKGYAVE